MVEHSGASALRYIGLADSSGYAAAATMTVRALRDIGVDVVWEPMVLSPSLGLGYAPATSLDAGPADLARLRDDGRSTETVVVHFVPEYYPYFLARERARGARRIIGQTIWETDRLPAHWPALINQLDAVIVPSEWNREVFASSGIVIPILISPHLPRFADLRVDPAERERLRARLPDLSGRRVFYTISTWLERKGVAPLIEAFTDAFTDDDPVALVIKTTPYDLERIRRDPGHEGERAPVLPQFEAMIGRAVLRRRRAPPPILLITDEMSDGEVLALHEWGDVFVSLFRGEGWGLGAFEAAWLGKPCIVTGWSGPTAYLSAETAYFVDWTATPVRPGEPNASYTPDQNWAEPDVASAVAGLRAVVADPGEAERRAKKAASHLRQTIEPDRVADQLWQDIRSVVPQARNALSSSSFWQRLAGGSSLSRRLMRALAGRRRARVSRRRGS